METLRSCQEPKCQIADTFWVIFVFIGAQVKLDLVWNISDAMNALMAIPNLIGLIFLSGVLFRETKAYEMGIRDGSIDKFD